VNQELQPLNRNLFSVGNMVEEISLKYDDAAPVVQSDGVSRHLVFGNIVLVPKPRATLLQPCRVGVHIYIWGAKIGRNDKSKGHRVRVRLWKVWKEDFEVGTGVKIPSVFLKLL
jgi:hypothetical protein